MHLYNRHAAAALLVSLAVAQLSCSSSSKPKPVQGGEDSSDTDQPGTDAAVRDAGAVQPGKADAGARPTDAGSPARRDAAAGDPDANTADASLPAMPAGSLRKSVCGDATSFPSPLPASNARTAQLVGTTRFGFIEGPVWIAELGVLLFSDMNFSGGNAKGPPSRIRRLKPPSSFDVLVETANSNGLALSLDGTVLAATHDTQSLSAFDRETGARTDLTVRYQGKRFNSPNDLTIRDDGTVYFSDPDYQIGSRTSEVGSQGVYRVSAPLEAAGGAAELVDGALQKPNGVALSPDQRTLYVGSSGNEVWKFSVASDGSVSNRTKFADVGGSDGMAVDCAGNLYVTSGTVEVFAPSGEKLGDISTGESPSNAAFGGPDRKTLYITAQTGLYSIALAVPGFPY